MGEIRIRPDDISVDESGRVVLSDAELEQACADAPLAGAGITNGLNCTNLQNCQNSLNTAVCTNASGACDGASNMRTCGTHSGFPGPGGG